jgi:hypothetical protein
MRGLEQKVIVASRNLYDQCEGLTGQFASEVILIGSGIMNTNYAYEVSCRLGQLLAAQKETRRHVGAGVSTRVMM